MRQRRLHARHLNQRRQPPKLVTVSMNGMSSLLSCHSAARPRVRQFNRNPDLSTKKQIQPIS
jgi:hypothetical protein